MPQLIELISDFLWSKLLVGLLLMAGLIFTVALRFPQFRYFGRMFGLLRHSAHREGAHLSSFQALALSVAGRVGAGNIAGVAVAISLAGPGAVFWMWVVAIIGMATSFCECTLGQLFKRCDDEGTYRGGPAFYIYHGLKKRWLANLFSVILLVTIGCAFASLQSFTVASSFENTIGAPKMVTGIALAGIVGAIIFGGIKRIADVAQTIVPVMAIAYFLVSMFVVLSNIPAIPGIIEMIVKNAFGIEEVAGGGVGAAMVVGVRRGLFSNEAGLGSAPNVASISYTKHPVEQGILQSFSVFIDTIILCTCTAVVILLSDAYAPGTQSDGVLLTQIALAEHLGEWGRPFVSISIALFGFTSIIYSYYLGENSLSFIFGNKRAMFNGYRIVLLLMVVWGASQDLTTVFSFTNLTMGALAIVNIAVILWLVRPVIRLVDDYNRQLNQGNAQPNFEIEDFRDLDIDERAWEKPGT